MAGDVAHVALFPYLERIGRILKSRLMGSEGKEMQFHLNLDLVCECGCLLELGKESILPRDKQLDCFSTKYLLRPVSRPWSIGSLSQHEEGSLCFQIILVTWKQRKRSPDVVQ